MRRTKTPSLRGSVTQNNISVRMRADGADGLGFLTRLGLVAGILLVVTGIGVWLWHEGWPQRQAAHLRDIALTATQKAQFAVKDVVVEGRHRASKEEILDALGTERGASIFDVDTQSAAIKMIKLPWISSATVERRLPDTIAVSLTEREPVARWQHDDHLYVIDNEGRVLPAAQAESFPALPLVVGASANIEAQALLALLKTYPDLLAKLDSAVRVGERRWDLHVQPKITIRLPESDVAAALRRLSVLTTQDKVFDRDIAAIDLRVPDRLIIEPATPAPPPKPVGKPAGGARL